MKLKKSKQFRTIGTAVSLALLVAAGNVSAGKPGNKGGASIAVSNACELEKDEFTGKPVLRVTTTIIDKSSAGLKEAVTFHDPGLVVMAMEKGRGKGKYEKVGETGKTAANLVKIDGITVTNIQLCDGDKYIGPQDTVSFNALVTIDVVNDNKSDYLNRCSDVEGTGINEGKVVVSAVELDILCETAISPL